MRQFFYEIFSSNWFYIIFLFSLFAAAYNGTKSTLSKRIRKEAEKYERAQNKSENVKNK